jgi:hypothetical protein
MQIGIDSFVATRKDPVTGIAPNASDRLRDLLEEIEHAAQAGVDSFEVGCTTGRISLIRRRV